MGLFGLVAGLFTASKVHDSIDKDHDDGFLEDAFETGISLGAGKVVKDIVDSVFDDDEDSDDDSWF